MMGYMFNEPPFFFSEPTVILKLEGTPTDTYRSLVPLVSNIRFDPVKTLSFLHDKY